MNFFFVFLDVLSNTFRQLKFHIVVEKNLTAVQVMELCTDLSAKDHKCFNALVVCVLSHGREGLVYGVDGREIYIKKITDMFIGARCPTLSGKPKLFFIQACQGTKEQTILSKISNKKIEKLKMFYPSLRVRHTNKLPIYVAFVWKYRECPVKPVYK